MTASLQLASTDRVQVFAPHPDDETLAAGELIQIARASGARVRVVFATDGENNPWPQRWLERRWRIGAADRARWAARRRGEAAIALAALGLDPVGDSCCLGWPDQGLTDVLMRDPRGVATLAAGITSFAPTHVVMPALADRHPDHNALHVMLELALLDVGAGCARLRYTVHGESGDASPLELPPDPARKRRKHAALEAHASQNALSRRRLFEIADRVERFEFVALASARTPAAPEAPCARIPLRDGWPSRGDHELLLVHASGTETLRFRAALPRRPRSTMSLVDACGRIVEARWVAGAIELESPWAAPAIVLYAKIHRAGARLVIHDREPWLDATGGTPQPVPLQVRPAAASLA